MVARKEITNIVRFLRVRFSVKGFGFGAELTVSGSRLGPCISPFRGMYSTTPQQPRTEGPKTRE